MSRRGGVALVVGALATLMGGATSAFASPELCHLPERAAARRAVQRAALVTSSEVEPNDVQMDATALTLGLGMGQDASVDVSAALTLPVPVSVPSSEDDGSITLATITGLTSGARVKTSGTIGDGPFGGASGDHDWYAVSALAGQQIVVDIDAQSISSPLDTYIGLYSSSGALLAKNDDEPGAGTTDSYLDLTAPITDTYFVVVRGFGRGFQADPFDSASGLGVASTGVYEVTIGLDPQDVDFFTFDLQAGDVFGAALSGASLELSLRDNAGVELVGSTSDVTAIYPAASPLPGGGNAALSWVVGASGAHVLRVAGGTGAYTLQLRVFRPPLTLEPQGTHQILFVDFDGAVVDAARFGGSGMRNLSPLGAALAGWGLMPAAEDAVIDAVLAVVAENFQDIADATINGDFDTSSVPGEFDIEIRNSRDHADPLSAPHITRVVVGGTIAELGINTVGTSESVDVGNFASSEVGVVLLDTLSAPSGAYSLNSVMLDISRTMVDLIGVAVGNAVSHEAGHLFGSFHTEGANSAAALMDRGTTLANLIGSGPDTIFGNSDDADVDFTADAYAASEPFSGVEDAATITAWDLSSGTAPALPTPSATESATETPSPIDSPTATATPTSTATRTITATMRLATMTPTPSRTPTQQPGLEACSTEPLIGCQTARRSTLLVRDGLDFRDSLAWKWMRGKAEIGDFGNPVGSTTLTFCLYDQSVLRQAIQVAPGGTCTPGVPCWRSTARGFAYRDKARTQQGVRALTMKSRKGVGSISLLGSDARLPLPPLPLAAPVTVQLVSSDGPCWESVFPTLANNTAVRVVGRVKLP